MIYEGLPEKPKGQVNAKFEFRLDGEGMLTIRASNNVDTTARSIGLATIARPELPRDVVSGAAEPAVGEVGTTSDTGIKNLVRSIWGKKT